MTTSLTPSVAAKEWFILQTRSNMEKKVATLLQERIQKSDISDQFGEVLVPVEKVIDIKNGQRKETMRKIYTGYVFVEAVMSDAVWHIIKGTTSVLGFVSGNQKRPTPVPLADMHKILERMRVTDEAPVPKLEFIIGEVVSIMDGPFKDFEGSIEQVNYNQQKLRVIVSIFGRPTPVDMDFAHVTKQ